MSQVFKPNKIVALVTYLLCFTLLGSILVYLILYLVSLGYNLEYGYLLNNINKKASEIGDLAYNAILLSKCVTNIIIYLIAIVVIVIFMRDELKIDFDKMKDNPKFYLLFSLTALAFVGLAYGINQLSLLLPQESVNQQGLVEMFKSNLGIPIIILTIIFAPLIEELVFRKCIFTFTKNSPVIVRFLISSVAFTIVHAISSIGSFEAGYFFLLCVPYFLDSMLLCAIYYFGKENVYMSFLAHLLNNVLALIFVLI